MVRIGSILALFLALLPSAAIAQEPLHLKQGTRVRVWTPSMIEPVTGTVLGSDATTLTLSADASALRVVVERKAITRLDRGYRMPRRKTALYGALIGVAAGVVVGMASGDDEGLLAMSATAKAGVYGVLLAPVGALVGLAAGPGPERWATVMAAPVSPRVLTAMPAASLRFSFRF